jgi:phosphoenolpyruvate-protein phosphotransferase
MAIVISARSASDGLAFGEPVVLTTAFITDDAPTTGSFAEAATATAAQFDALSAAADAEGREDEAEILDAYGMIALDPSLATTVQAELDTGAAPVAAVRAAIATVSATFRAMADEYLAQRADDVEAVGRELIATLTGTTTAGHSLPDGAIICAADLSPADTVKLDLQRVGGIATERGGPTSHTAIVARSLGIPAVVGASGLLDALTGAELVLIDGERGELVVDPGIELVRDAELRMGSAKVLAVEHRKLRGHQVAFDGTRILVAGNVGALHDLDAAVETAADGIGLFRSEFLFLERAHAPSAEEQRQAYRAAVEAFEDPTVVRTLDIGGDKEVPYLDLPTEENPFLGVRGLRLCLAMPELFDVQLDALVQVAGDGRLRVMFPMVSSVADLDAGLARLTARAELAGSPPPAPGIMIETPASALLARHLAPRCAFFSIGTNDLTQYVAAADRGLGALGSYQDPAQPAVLRLIAMTCEAASEAGIPVAVCGEAASDPATAALLLGLGVEELSVAPSLVDRTRWLVTQLDPVATRSAAQRALAASDADAVREIAAAVLP